MAELPPPGSPLPAPIPRPPAATPEQAAAFTRRNYIWMGVASAVGVLVLVAQVLPEQKDDPPPPSRAEIAEQTWDRMSLSGQAAICDGYNQFGESFTVENLLEGTDGDERMARALLDVVKDEC